MYVAKKSSSTPPLMIQAIEMPSLACIPVDFVIVDNAQFEDAPIKLARSAFNASEASRINSATMLCNKYGWVTC